MTYWFWTIFSLLLAAAILAGVLWMVAGDLYGAPFVPSDRKFLRRIMQEMHLSRGARFLDIGSGDGRTVRLAALQYGLTATGLELQPYLVWYARLADRLKKVRNTSYIRGDFFHRKLPQADFIYFYLYPRTVEKLSRKILEECRPGTVVVSRAFEVKNLRSRLYKKIEEEGKRAYFYRV